MRFVDGPDLPSIDKGTFVVLSVPKCDVVEKNYVRTLQVISQLEKLGKDARGHLEILFEYNDVIEEVFEIAEIRDWVTGLLQKVPYLFYFVTYLHENQQTLAACLGDVIAIKIGEQPESPAKLMAKLLSENSPDMLLDIRLSAIMCDLIFRAALAYAFRVEETEDGIEEFVTKSLSQPWLIRNLDVEFFKTILDMG
jgi:hypothetical protein